MQEKKSKSFRDFGAYSTASVLRMIVDYMDICKTSKTGPWYLYGINCLMNIFLPYDGLYKIVNHT